MRRKYYKIYIDTGGTFTDCIAIDSTGLEHRTKVLSNSTLRGNILHQVDQSTLLINENWKLEKDILKGFKFQSLSKNYTATIKSFNLDTKLLELNKPINLDELNSNLNFEITSNEEAPILAIRLITKTALSEPFPDLILKLGSTKGTNALLEKKGANTLHITTKGFKDLLEIGNQARPEIFSLNIEKRKQLYSKVIEVDERIDAKGNILQNLDIEKLELQLNSININEIQSVSIALLNSYKNPENEIKLKNYFQNLGLKFISTSSELSPLIKFLSRAETTVANSYLAPIIHNYVENIKAKIGKNQFQIMTSAGSLVNAENFHPKDSLLSGPAGGVVGATIIGKQLGFEKLITFDMGGTSTDVSRYNHDFDYQFELQVGDSHINSSAISIETVAAGGGSICGYDGYKLFVGPESASAFPGPACYGAGGPLTITDVNLLLGRLDASQFGIPINNKAAEIKLNELIQTIELTTHQPQNSSEILNGFLKIANEIMAGAIRKISLAKGYNPKEFSMVAFGGAGGLHACDIADILGIKNILLPKDAGLLSAFGIGNANIERFAEKQILQAYSKIENQLKEEYNQLIKNSISQLVEEGFKNEEVSIRQQMIFLRYSGQDTSLEVDFQSENIINEFELKYFKIYGHQVSQRVVEVETIRVIASVQTIQNKHKIESVKKIQPNTNKTNSINNTPIFVRKQLKPGTKINGKALLLDHYSATFLKEGWNLKIETNNTAVLQKQEIEAANIKQTQETELELFANRFMAIAENMGAILQRTALSVNIKERLDFSCALLDQDGQLVANAPHIPVHLGGLGVCVRSILKNYNFENGDTIVTNHPKFGGSHLPDVTLITPVFHKNKRVAFVVNRAHHSEIGGISPGSMPPNAKNLSEEGVVIAPFYLIKKGKADWNGMRSILENSKYPSRSIEENLADLNAAIAANINGKNAVLELIHQYGSTIVLKYFDLLRNHAHQKIQHTLKKFTNGQYEALESLDDNSPIKVKIQIKNGKCKINFEGSASVHPGNMNATEAIVQSVIIYVMHILVDEPIPLNDGLMNAVSINLPHGILNPVFDDNPEKCPAVVGGNVEISMRLTDTLLKAFGVVAASQGTMNNTLFGNKNFGYYETICGGTGAGNGFHGASAVHQHMTNTRITDPEILEHRYPVRLEEFSIRTNSGGNGKYNGGNGVKRVIRFMEPVNLSVLTQRRKTGPYGLNDAKNGKPGAQIITKNDGSILKLDNIQNINIKKGELFTIFTPGGGGYNPPKK